MLWGRRTEIDILQEILELREATKTKVMYFVNLSYEQTQKYIDLLTRIGLIEMRANENGRPLIRTTEKGRCVLACIKELQKQLDSES